VLTHLLHRAAAHPRVYDLIQAAFGYAQLVRLVEPRLAETADHLVADVGAGTGNAAKLLPPSARYVWLDLDPDKLRGYRAKNPAGRAALCDATRLCLGPASADYVLCMAVAHHLTDPQLDDLLREAARVARRGIFFWEPVADHSRLRSNLMWRYDRGSYPRTHTELAERLGRWFHSDRVEAHTIVHRYLWFAGRPLTPAPARAA
jgi:SAM-dependent methyltransferase